MSFDKIQRTKVGHIELAFREQGNGDPILLIHGWPLSSLTWRKVVPTLAQDGRCIAVDLLGAGESITPVGERLDVASQAERLAGFLDALGIERATVIGHDSGGSIARNLACAHPQRVSRLVLADTEVPGHRPLMVVALQAAARLPGSAFLLRQVLASKLLAKSPLGFAAAFGDVTSFDFDEFYETLAPTASSEERFRGTAQFIRDFDFADVDSLRDRYDVLTMPKLLIWGEQDRFFPLDQGRRLVGMLPAPKDLEHVADAGLLIHEEQPGEWIQVVRNFLAENPG